MGEGTYDKVTGQAKETVGDVTGDESLEREGKVDQAAGSLKDTVGDIVDKVKDAAGDLVDKVKDLANRDKEPS
jgi:uncharacterized protein YjbJ (UPF0337 family)